MCFNILLFTQSNKKLPNTEIIYSLLKKHEAFGRGYFQILSYRYPYFVSTFFFNDAKFNINLINGKNFKQRFFPKKRIIFKIHEYHEALATWSTDQCTKKNKKK